MAELQSQKMRGVHTGSGTSQTDHWSRAQGRSFVPHVHPSDDKMQEYLKFQG